MNEYNTIIHKSDIYSNLELLPLEIEGNNICDANKTSVLSMVKSDSPIIIEVGSWKGSSAIEMAKYFTSNGKIPTIFCVDTWNGAAFHRRDDFWQNQLKCKNGYPQIYYQFLSNVVYNNCQEYIVPIPLNSSDGARFLKKFNIVADLVYIDASHEYEDVVGDLMFYSNLVKSGGIFFGDDYDVAWPGVYAGVNWFIDQYKLHKAFSKIHSQWIINTNLFDAKP